MSALLFKQGDPVRKVGGTYEADGHIVGVAITKAGAVRYVFEFVEPDGMLHIFNEGQLRAREGTPCTPALEPNAGPDTDGGPRPHYDREALAKKMVDLFLGWELPRDFAPDGGVSFVPPFHWPTGTNLLHAGQALEMFRYCLGLDAAGEELRPRGSHG